MHLFWEQRRYVQPLNLPTICFLALIVATVLLIVTYLVLVQHMIWFKTVSKQLRYLHGRLFMGILSFPPTTQELDQPKSLISFSEIQPRDTSHTETYDSDHALLYRPIYMSMVIPWGSPKILWYIGNRVSRIATEEAVTLNLSSFDCNI